VPAAIIISVIGIEQNKEIVFPIHRSTPLGTPNIPIVSYSQAQSSHAPFEFREVVFRPQIVGHFSVIRLLHNTNVFAYILA